MGEHNVLVLAYYFPPMGLSGVQRTAKFVKYLPENGWNPFVITTGPVAYYAHDQSLLDELNNERISIHRTVGKDPNALLKKKGTMKMPREVIRKTLSSLSNMFFIPDNKKSWARQAMEIAREIISQNKIDVIFVSGPPFSAMIAGAQLSSETGIPLVLDYRDLWYGNQFHSYPTLWHAEQHRKLEQATLSRTSRITVTNRRIKEKILATYSYLTHEDVVIIPHGFDSEDFAALKAPSLNNKSGAFTLTYSGIFYDFVTPIPFFKAIKSLRKKNPDISLELNFVGLVRDQYKKKAKRMGLSDIIVDYGYLPHREALQVMMESDALWMMVGNARNADTISSGKLYEYFGTKKPLLVSVPEGTLKRDAQRYGAAWITEPDDVEAIEASILEMYEHWQKNSMPKPDVEFVNQFERRQLTQELAKVLATSLRLM